MGQVEGDLVALEKLGKVVEQFLSIPQRKAVTGLTFIPYPEVKKSEPSKKPFGEMTEAEVKARVEAWVAEQVARGLFWIRHYSTP